MNYNTERKIRAFLNGVAEGFIVGLIAIAVYLLIIK